MVVEPAFTYFFHITERDWGQNTVAIRSLLPSSENLVNKIKVQNVIFIFLKQFPI